MRIVKRNYTDCVMCFVMLNMCFPLLEKNSFCIINGRNIVGYEFKLLICINNWSFSCFCYCYIILEIIESHQFFFFTLMRKHRGYLGRIIFYLLTQIILYLNAVPILTALVKNYINF